MKVCQFLRKNRLLCESQRRWGEARVVLDCCLPEARSDVFRVHSQFGEGELAVLCVWGARDFQAFLKSVVGGCSSVSSMRCIQPCSVNKELARM